MQDFLMFFASFLIGLAVGCLTAWMFLKSRFNTEAQWADKFKTLATDTLRDNHQSFLNLAESRLKQTEIAAAASLEQKSTAINEVLKPVQESLKRMDTQLQALEVKREGAYTELLKMVQLSHETHQQLRGETSQLLQALRSPTSRGTWGQMQLKRILEMTGMAAHAKDFTAQATFTTEDGQLRPDFVVSLPGNRCVVFDSKVPFNSYLAHTQTTDGDAQKNHLVQHAKQVREHIRALGNKEYWAQIETTPEFVVLFMPGDHLLGAALETDPELMDFGIKQRVVLATPTTVIALLWSVAYGWRQEALTNNVQKVKELGGDLYNALLIMTKHFTDIGGKLSGSVKSYNDAVGSFERNVLSKARRLKDYGAAKDGKALPDELEAIDLQTRSLTSPDYAADEDAA